MPHRLTSPRAALPQELVDAIVDYHSSKLDTLKTCSLVSRAWLSSARRYLLKNVIICRSNADGFPEFLAAAPPNVRNLVRSVHLRSHSSTWLSNFTPKLVRYLSSQFCAGDPSGGPRVTTLTITARHRLLTLDTVLALKAFDLVEELRLVECLFWGFSQVQDLICSYPRLRTLVLDRSCWADGPYPGMCAAANMWPSKRMKYNERSVPLPRPPANLNDILLRCDKTHILDWFLSLPSPPPLTRLLLDNIAPGEANNIGRYLMQIRETLTELILCPDPHTYTYLREHVDLSSHHQLRCLGLVIDCSMPDLEFAKDVISKAVSAPSSCLEEVMFWFDKIPKYDASVHQAMDWGSLDEVLIKAHEQRALKAVTVRACFNQWGAGALLRRCCLREILDF